MGLSFICMLLICAGLSILRYRLDLQGSLSGLKLGLFTGLIFSTAIIAINYLYEKKPIWPAVDQRWLCIGWTDRRSHDHMHLVFNDNFKFSNILFAIHFKSHICKEGISCLNPGLLAGMGALAFPSFGSPAPSPGSDGIEPVLLPPCHHLEHHGD